MSNVINFAKAKADVNKDRSEHILTMQVYMNADNSEVWAGVENVDQQAIDASWHTFVANLLRQLAWFSDGTAAELDADVGPPIASVTLFEDRRISTRWNETLVTDQGHVDWIKKQLLSGAEEISATLNEVK